MEDDTPLAGVLIVALLMSLGLAVCALVFAALEARALARRALARLVRAARESCR